MWHGRVEIDRKGLDVLLEAWDRLTEERGDRDLRLIMVGTGTDAEELRRRLGSSRGVLWLDRFVLERAEVRRLLSAADVYAFPSRFEGFPVAPIEAMACGLPVVAADAAGVSDILGPEDGAGGFVVPAGDARALGDRLDWLLEDTRRAREIGARARRRVEDAFSLPAVGRALSGFIFGEQAGR
jgi:starch synthase